MRRVLLVLAVVWGATASAQFAAPVGRPQRPIPEIERVVIISIDGLRPDRALLANMPTLRALLQEGAYTFWAKTTAVAVTLPSHTSMVTGVVPGKHGITWNYDLPLSEPVYPWRPTVMEMAKKAGYLTAMVAGKSKFSALQKPGTLTQSFVPPPDGGDNALVVAEATKIIEQHKPDLLFLHFPDVDRAGHASGWGSREQLAAIERTDGDLANILAALERAGLRKTALVIMSADHGGAGLTHGADDPRSRYIPWIAAGPGVRKGFDLTQIGPLEVRTEDTCATACYVLGLPQQPYFDGKPVYEAFDAAK